MKNKKYKKYHKGKKVSGVPVGYPESWFYKGRWNEKKIDHGKWKINFGAIKSRPAKSYGSFGKGTTGKWGIKAVQYIKKIGKGKYQTRMIGIKKSLGFKVKKPSRKKYGRRTYKRWRRAGKIKKDDKRLLPSNLGGKRWENEKYIKERVITEKTEETKEAQERNIKKELLYLIVVLIRDTKDYTDNFTFFYNEKTWKSNTY